MCFDSNFWKLVILFDCLKTYIFYFKKQEHFKDQYFKPFFSFSVSCGKAMRSTSATFILAVTITICFFCDSSLGGLWVCKPCENQAACDADPVDYCIWGEVRDACNRRVCAKGPGERCGGSLNILGQCGEGMMCKSDERCHGCSIQTMQCHND